MAAAPSSTRKGKSSSAVEKDLQELNIRGKLVLACLFLLVFSQRVVDRWNGLQQSTIDCATVNAFKNGLNQMRQMKMGYFMD